MRMLFLYGAGGHGKVALDCARVTGDYDSIAFIDDNSCAAGTVCCGCPVLGGREILTTLKSPRDIGFLVAIGDNSLRARIYLELLALGLTPRTLIHPTATIAPSCRIGAGSLILPRAVLNADSIVQSNCIVNTGAIIEHDCKVGDHVHLSPGVCLGGRAKVAAGAHLGIGAIVLPGVGIGESAVVGAGSVVLKDVPAGLTVAGVPAKPIRAAFR